MITLGVILLVIAVALTLLGAMGRAVGERKTYYWANDPRSPSFEVQPREVHGHRPKHLLSLLLIAGVLGLVVLVVVLIGHRLRSSYDGHHVRTGSGRRSRR